MKKKLANYILKHRKKVNITQQELADAVSVSRQTIVAIEKGNYTPSVSLALSFAKYFNVSVEELFYEE